MIDRHLFTSAPTRGQKLADVLVAIVLGLALACLALAYFDVLIK